MTTGSSIDYDALTQDALRGVVRNVLNQVAKTGLLGEHHFYIAFNTQAPGVVLSRRLREKYPEEMMVVLQHRFWDLAATDEGFEVKLTFDGIPERLYVPFSSLRVFHDPSVRFTLQFGENVGADDPQEAAGGRRRREGGENAARAGADRRGRTRPRSRTEGATEQSDQPVAEAEAQAQPQSQPSPAQPQLVPSAPVVFAPRAVETKKPAPAPTASEPAAPDAGGKQVAGANVFSLDQFRKK